MIPDNKLAIQQAEKIALAIEILLQSLEESPDINQKNLKVAKYHLTIGRVQLYKAIKGQQDELC